MKPSVVVVALLLLASVAVQGRENGVSVGVAASVGEACTAEQRPPHAA